MPTHPYRAAETRDENQQVFSVRVYDRKGLLLYTDYKDRNGNYLYQYITLQNNRLPFVPGVVFGNYPVAQKEELGTPVTDNVGVEWRDNPQAIARNADMSFRHNRGEIDTPVIWPVADAAERIKLFEKSRNAILRKAGYSKKELVDFKIT